MKNTFTEYLFENNLNKYIENQPEEIADSVTELTKRLFKKQGKRIGAESLEIPYIRDIVEKDKDPQFFIKAAKQILDLDSPFKKQTDLASYDDVLNKPDYFKDNKGIYFKIVNLSPDKYNEHVERGFKRSGEQGEFEPKMKLVKEYAEQMLKGSQAPMPVLEYQLSDKREFDFNQEGRHRAHAAKYIGVKEIPVMVVIKPVPPKFRHEEKYNQFIDQIFSKFEG